MVKVLVQIFYSFFVEPSAIQELYFTSSDGQTPPLRHWGGGAASLFCLARELKLNFGKLLIAAEFRYNNE